MVLDEVDARPRGLKVDETADGHGLVDVTTRANACVKQIDGDGPVVLAKVGLLNDNDPRTGFDLCIPGQRGAVEGRAGHGDGITGQSRGGVEDDRGAVKTGRIHVVRDGTADIDQAHRDLEVFGHRTVVDDVGSVSVKVVGHVGESFLAAFHDVRRADRHEEFPDTVVVGGDVGREGRAVEARHVHHDPCNAFVGVGRVVGVKVPVEPATDFHLVVRKQIRHVHRRTGGGGEGGRRGVERPAVLGVFALHVDRPRAGHHGLADVASIVGQVKRNIAKAVRRNQGHAEAREVLLAECFTEVEVHIGSIHRRQSEVNASAVLVHLQGVAEDFRAVLSVEGPDHGDPIAAWDVIREGSVLVHGDVAVIGAVGGNQQHAVALRLQRSTVRVNE